MLRIVAATRHDKDGFHAQAMLARSMTKFSVRGNMFFMLHQCQPPAGLPDCYNGSLAACEDGDTVLFTHDDVWLDDWYLPERLDDALAKFDVVGVAGNRRRVPSQPAWAFPDRTFKWDAPEYLTGSITHLQKQHEKLDWFGPAPASAALLDGVFLAAKVNTLRSAGVAFDPRFKFNFYDLDFCRSCERAGLRMGTWPISVTHGSIGRFGNADWQAGYDEYLRKWGD